VFGGSTRLLDWPKAQAPSPAELYYVHMQIVMYGGAKPLARSPDVSCAMLVMSRASGLVATCSVYDRTAHGMQLEQLYTRQRTSDRNLNPSNPRTHAAHTF
jgi:hypothetical protein